MKKKSLSVLLCMAMLVFGSAALTGCGNKDSETGGNPESRTEGSTRGQSNTNTTQDESKEESPADNAEAAYTTLEGYFETAEGAEDLAAFKEGLIEDGITMDVEGNVVICTYRLDDIALSDYSEEDKAAILAQMQETMPSTMEDLSGYFTPSVKYFEEASGLEGVVFKVVYADANGELLYEHEFTSK